MELTVVASGDEELLRACGGLRGKVVTETPSPTTANMLRPVSLRSEPRTGGPRRMLHAQYLLTPEEAASLRSKIEDGPMMHYVNEAPPPHAAPRQLCLTIGRDRDQCNAMIAMKLAHGPLLSRRHCTLSLQLCDLPGPSTRLAMTVHDHESLNGTFVDGRRLERGAVSAPVLMDLLHEPAVAAGVEPLMVVGFGAGAKTPAGGQLPEGEMRLRLHVYVKAFWHWHATTPLRSLGELNQPHLLRAMLRKSAQTSVVEAALVRTLQQLMAASACHGQEVEEDGTSILAEMDVATSCRSRIDDVVAGARQQHLLVGSDGLLRRAHDDEKGNTNNNNSTSTHHTSSINASPLPMAEVMDDVNDVPPPLEEVVMVSSPPQTLMATKTLTGEDPVAEDDDADIVGISPPLSQLLQELQAVDEDGPPSLAWIARPRTSRTSAIAGNGDGHGSRSSSLDSFVVASSQPTTTAEVPVSVGHDSTNSLSSPASKKKGHGRSAAKVVRRSAADTVALFMEEIQTKVLARERRTSTATSSTVVPTMVPLTDIATSSKAEPAEEMMVLMPICHVHDEIQKPAHGNDDDDDVAARRSSSTDSDLLISDLLSSEPAKVCDGRDSAATAVLSPRSTMGVLERAQYSCGLAEMEMEMKEQQELDEASSTSQWPNSQSQVVLISTPDEMHHTRSMVLQDCVAGFSSQRFVGRPQPPRPPPRLELHPSSSSDNPPRNVNETMKELATTTTTTTTTTTATATTTTTTKLINPQRHRLPAFYITDDVLLPHRLLQHQWAGLRFLWTRLLDPPPPPSASTRTAVRGGWAAQLSGRGRKTATTTTTTTDASSCVPRVALLTGGRGLGKSAMVAIFLRWWSECRRTYPHATSVAAGASVERAGRVVVAVPALLLGQWAEVLRSWGDGSEDHRQVEEEGHALRVWMLSSDCSVSVRHARIAAWAAPPHIKTLSVLLTSHELLMRLLRRGGGTAERVMGDDDENNVGCDVAPVAAPPPLPESFWEDEEESSSSSRSISPVPQEPLPVGAAPARAARRPLPARPSSARVAVRLELESECRHLLLHHAQLVVVDEGQKAARKHAALAQTLRCFPVEVSRLVVSGHLHDDDGRRSLVRSILPDDGGVGPSTTPLMPWMRLRDEMHVVASASVHLDDDVELPRLVETTLIFGLSEVQQKLLRGLVEAFSNEAPSHYRQQTAFASHVMAISNHCELVRDWLHRRGVGSGGHGDDDFGGGGVAHGDPRIAWALPCMQLPSIFAEDGSTHTEHHPHQSSAGLAVGDLAHSFKLHGLLQLLRVARASGERVVVLSHSITSLVLVGSLLEQRQNLADGADFGLLTASLPVPRRQELLQRFTDRGSSLTVLLLPAVGAAEGLSIPGVDRVVVVDLARNAESENAAVLAMRRLERRPSLAAPRRAIYVNRLVSATPMEMASLPPTTVAAMRNARDDVVAKLAAELDLLFPAKTEAREVLPVAAPTLTAARGRFSILAARHKRARSVSPPPPTNNVATSSRTRATTVIRPVAETRGGSNPTTAQMISFMKRMEQYSEERRDHVLGSAVAVDHVLRALHEEDEDGEAAWSAVVMAAVIDARIPDILTTPPNGGRHR